MEIKKKSFVIYTTMLEEYEEFTYEQKGKLFEAMIKYHLDQNYQTNDVLVNFAMKQNIKVFKYNKEKYEKKVERARENGKKGGRPSKISKTIEQQEKQMQKKEIKQEQTISIKENKIKPTDKQKNILYGFLTSEQLNKLVELNLLNQKSLNFVVSKIIKKEVSGQFPFPKQNYKNFGEEFNLTDDEFNLQIAKWYNDNFKE